MLGALILVAAGLLGTQVEIPKSQGWVTDVAGLLQPQERQALEALMESYASGTSHEIALLTMPSLEGTAIEPFALNVARSWGLGGKEQNNGALLVVAVQDRKLRIEVGRGLEGPLPDSICGRIIRDVITPELKAGRYYQGISEGLGAMHAAIGGDYGPIERRRSRGPGGVTGLLGLIPMILLAVVLGRRRRGLRRGGMGGVLPWMVAGSMMGSRSHRGGGGGFSSGGGFGGFGGGGGFSGGGASGGW